MQKDAPTSARLFSLSVCRDEHCSSGIRNECNLPKANLTSRSPPRRKVAGRFHRGPQANPTSRTAATQGRSPCLAIVCFANADEQCSSGIRNECNLPEANPTSRSPPRRKVAGRFHRGPQANPTSRAAVTQGDRPAGRLFASQTRTSDARPYILPVMLRRDEHCSSGIRNECNLPKANLTSRSPPRRKVAGRFHRGPQANPTSRVAATQGDRPAGRLFASQTRTSDARPYIRSPPAS